MKVVKADPLHSYHVFKLLRDYADDSQTPRPSLESYAELLHNLLDEKKDYRIILHGRAAVGLIWGSIDGSQFTLQGRYLRRKYRNFRFKRVLVEETLALRQSFGKLRLALPPKAKVSPRYNPVALIVEER